MKPYKFSKKNLMLVLYLQLFESYIVPSVLLIVVMTAIYLNYCYFILVYVDRTIKLIE